MLLLLDERRATGEGIAEHVIRPAKEIPASHVEAGHTQMKIIIQRNCNWLQWMEDWREGSMAGIGEKAFSHM